MGLQGSGIAPSGARAPSVPSEVASLTTCFLTAADAIVPGLVRGLYMTGSVALGDFRSHCSDVDFVAVSENRPDGAELEGLASVHGVVVAAHPKLHFDGIHLTWSDLQGGPIACGPAPFIHAGCFNPSGTFAIDPVTWHELADHGLPLRGPLLSGTAVWRDNAGLRAWTLGNLVHYWRPWTIKYREGPPALDGSHGLVCWGVLGVARLHYTLATGCITSKTAAGQYALKAFDRRWERVVSEALRLRADPTLASQYGDLSERRADVADFAFSVIESGLRLGTV
jgi:hypothetical protein